MKIAPEPLRAHVLGGGGRHRACRLSWDHGAPRLLYGRLIVQEHDDMSSEFRPGFDLRWEGENVSTQGTPTGRKQALG